MILVFELVHHTWPGFPGLSQLMSLTSSNTALFDVFPTVRSEPGIRLRVHSLFFLGVHRRHRKGLNATSRRTVRGTLYSVVAVRRSQQVIVRPIDTLGLSRFLRRTAVMVTATMAGRISMTKIQLDEGILF